MIKYTGKADYQRLDIQIFGDGYTKDVSIDLSKAPFNISFKGFYPKDIVFSNTSHGTAKSLALNGDNLIIIFEEPPEAVDFSTQELIAAPQNRLMFSIYFVYGTGLEGRTL